jgi:hypothetical protein
MYNKSMDKNLTCAVWLSKPGSQLEKSDAELVVGEEFISLNNLEGTFFSSLITETIVSKGRALTYSIETSLPKSVYYIDFSPSGNSAIDNMTKFKALTALSKKSTKPYYRLLMAGAILMLTGGVVLWYYSRTH